MMFPLCVENITVAAVIHAPLKLTEQSGGARSIRNRLFKSSSTRIRTGKPTLVRYTTTKNRYEFRNTPRHRDYTGRSAGKCSLGWSNPLFVQSSPLPIFEASAGALGTGHGG